MSVITNASWCLAIAGILLGLGAVAVFHQPLLGLRVMIELFTAAGLLRLSVDLSWTAILGVVVLIAVRRVVTRNLTVDFGDTKALSSP